MGIPHLEAIEKVLSEPGVAEMTATAIRNRLGANREVVQESLDYLRDKGKVRRRKEKDRVWWSWIR